LIDRVGDGEGMATFLPAGFEDIDDVGDGDRELVDFLLFEEFSSSVETDVLLSDDIELFIALY
jgi:hypothetical protein